MVNFLKRRKTDFKIKSIRTMRREHAARVRRRADAEVTSAEVAPAEVISVEVTSAEVTSGEVTSGDITFESIKEALVHIGLLDRFKLINPSNSRAPGTALTRLEDVAAHFGVRPPVTCKQVIGFYINLSPANIECYTKHLAGNMDRAASTIYSYLCGNFYIHI